MEKIQNRYPFLEDKDPHTYLQPDETWVDCLPLGWRNRFMQYCEEVADLFRRSNIEMSEFTIAQAKEKFGAARVYFEGPTTLYEQITEITDRFEEESGRICSCCGKPATHRSKGWILPYCLPCAQATNTTANERHRTKVSLNEAFTTF